MARESRTLTKFNSWLALIANLGVIGGLVFLGFEIQQNTTQLRAEAGYSINEALSMQNSSLYGDRQLADILERGEKNLSSLDSTESRQFFAYQWDRINLALYIEKLERDGVSQVHFPYIEFLIQDFHQKAGLQQFLRAIESEYVGDRMLFNRMKARQSEE